MTSAPPKRRILIADDNKFNRALVQAMLAKKGFSTEEAKTGIEAINKLCECSFDLILMDLQMPELDGILTTIQIRKKVKEFSLPIIALTASWREEDKRKCFDAGMNDFILKPVTPTKLIETVNKWMHMTTEGMHQVIPSSQKEVGASPVFDRYVFLTRCGNNHHLLNKLLNYFIEISFEDLIRLESAINNNNAKEVRMLAHSLKGAAANVSAAYIEESARLIEKASDSNDMETIKICFTQLQRRVNEFSDAISNINFID